MKELQWYPSYTMGSKVIDGHHQTLIHCINDLDRAIDKGKVDPAYLSELAGKLEDYTQYHFKVEEDYMSRYQYPELVVHQEEHKEFIDEVKKLKENLRSSSKDAGLKMTSYLKAWLIHHILIIDKEYAIWFQQKGIRLT